MELSWAHPKCQSLDGNPCFLSFVPMHFLCIPPGCLCLAYSCCEHQRHASAYRTVRVTDGWAQ